MAVSMRMEELVGSYCAAWNESDAVRRTELLNRAWADDGIYQDPTSRVDGRAAVLEHLAGFGHRFPGVRIELTSGVDGYGDTFRFAWVMVDADGSPVMEGVDFGRIAEDGRIASITGFFGPWPAC